SLRGEFCSLSRRSRRAPGSDATNLTYSQARSGCDDLRAITSILPQATVDCPCPIGPGGKAVMSKRRRPSVARVTYLPDQVPLIEHATWPALKTSSSESWRRKGGLTPSFQ